MRKITFIKDGEVTIVRQPITMRMSYVYDVLKNGEAEEKEDVLKRAMEICALVLKPSYYYTAEGQVYGLVNAYLMEKYLTDTYENLKWINTPCISHRYNKADADLIDDITDAVIECKIMKPYAKLTYESWHNADIAIIYDKDAKKLYHKHLKTEEDWQLLAEDVYIDLFDTEPYKLNKKLYEI